MLTSYDDFTSNHKERKPMKPLRRFAHAFAVVSLLSAASFTVQAEDILIDAVATEDVVNTKVLAVDLDKRVVTVAGPENSEVPIQVSEQAKDLHNLKVGDLVNITVNRSVATVLETDLTKARASARRPVSFAPPRTTLTQVVRHFGRSRSPRRSPRST